MASRSSPSDHSNGDEESLSNALADMNTGDKIPIGWSPNDISHLRGLIEPACCDLKLAIPTDSEKTALAVLFAHECYELKTEPGEITKAVVKVQIYHHANYERLKQAATELFETQAKLKLFYNFSQLVRIACDAGRIVDDALTKQYSFLENDSDCLSVYSDDNIQDNTAPTTHTDSACRGGGCSGGAIGSNSTHTYGTRSKGSLSNTIKNGAWCKLYIEHFCRC